MNKQKMYLLFMFIGILIILFFSFYDKAVSLLSNGSIPEMVEWIRSFGIIGPIISILLMIFQAIAAPLPSFLITGANGIVFGIGWGIFISWLGAMLGALVSFYIAKWFGSSIKGEKTKKLMESVESFSGKHGFMIVVIARILPVISFDLISYAAGLSQMKVRSFLIATGIGMLPGTILYTVMGNDVLKLEENIERFVSMLLILIILLTLGYVVKRKLQKQERL